MASNLIIILDIGFMLMIDTCTMISVHVFIFTVSNVIILYNYNS
jgi:hypothetical protein